MKKKTYRRSFDTVAALLVLLWAYAASSKLLDYPLSLHQMHNQVFPVWAADLLAAAVPLTEICTAVLLLLPLFRRAGLWLSALLLGSFTLYIVLVKLLVFGRVPCSCGGIISGFSWTQHLIFNLFFLALSILGLWFYRGDAPSKERRWHGKAP